jgi:hypothetical protein
VVIAGHGLSIDVPEGWEARIVRRGHAGPVLHVASFALHDGDGDFGAAATGRMRSDDRFLTVIEYLTGEGLEAGRGLFAADGRPAAFKPRDFTSRQLQVTRRGQYGAQRFFTEAGRPLCAYAVIQPGRVAAVRLVEELNAVMASLEVARGNSRSGGVGTTTT